MALNRFFLGAFYLAPAFAAILFIASAISQAWPFWQQAFRSDNSSISWLSSAQLWTIAFTTLLLVKERKLPNLLGGWFFIVMLMMAMDEQFQFHEQWKYGCDEWVTWCDSILIKELPILCIALVGSMSTFWLFHYCATRLSKIALVIAILLGLVAISMDLGFVPGFLFIFEEGFEVMGEAFWLSCLFSLTTKDH